MISVVLADDHTLIRDLFRRLLDSVGDIQIVAVASNGQEAVEQAVLYKPNVAVLDISMPSMNGIEAARQIIVQCPQTHILMATMHNTSLYIEHSIIAGVLGYVLKDQASYDLVIAIRTVNEGNRYFSKQIEEIAKRFIK